MTLAHKSDIKPFPKTAPIKQNLRIEKSIIPIIFFQRHTFTFELHLFPKSFLNRTIHVRISNYKNLPQTKTCTVKPKIMQLLYTMQTFKTLVRSFSNYQKNIFHVFNQKKNQTLKYDSLKKLLILNKIHMKLLNN